MPGRERGVSAVVGVVLLLAVAVLLAVTVGTLALGLGEQTQPTAPTTSVSYELVDRGDGSGEQLIAITKRSGEPVKTDYPYVGGSTPLDIGAGPESDRPTADSDSKASGLEAFTESYMGAPPQVGIGDAWEAGETVYVDPVGEASGTDVTLYWNTRDVAGNNPGEVEGSDSYDIGSFTA
ncbi:flagellin-like protein [Halarchaeum solikamskense]|uniref:type IV pilin n=1 Tax=Halarchaeum nitratireducens TaxID=489913 RepID=UPI001B3AB2AA|nr:type IV pilin [Halarchaeum solikamskense]MBP2252256.1 flagellin-like protein [Halarchaeum solikamskense]